MTRKKCTRCLKIKAVGEFIRNQSKKSGYCDQCKVCLKKYRDKKENKEKKRLYDQRYREKNLSKLVRKRRKRYKWQKEAVLYKAGLKREICRWVAFFEGCKICGVKKDLHFHHREPKKKRFKIGKDGERSWQSELTEMNKCDVLCGLHHNQVHHIFRGHKVKSTRKFANYMKTVYNIELKKVKNESK